MKIQITMNSGVLSLPDATAIQFDREDVLIFTASNGYSKLSERDIQEIRIAPSDPPLPVFSRVALVKYLKEKKNLGFMEAYTRVKEFLGE